MSKSVTRPNPLPRSMGDVVSFGDVMPSAPEAERTLLAAVFSDGTCGAVDAPSLRAAIAEGICSRHFCDNLNRQIFQAMRALHTANAPVEISAVWQAIEAEHGEVSAEIRDRALDLSREPVSSLHVARCVLELRKAEASRQQARGAAELVQALRDGNEDEQREARRKIADAGQEDRGGLPRIVSCAELVARECRAPPVLVSGLIHRGGKLLLGGGSKSFKSWALIDLSLSIAAGRDFWGLKTTQGRVLFLNFEIAEPFFRDRLMAVAKAKEIELAAAGRNLDVQTLRGHAADISKLAPHIIAQAAGRDYSLIVLDPVYKCLGDRDENSAGEIASLLNEIEALAVRTGAAVCIAHHFAKGSAAGKESKDRVSGSGVWARDPDALMTLTPHVQEGVFSADFTVRNFAPLPSFCLRWNWPLMRRDEGLDPAELKQPGRPRQFNTAMLLSLLPDGGATYSEWLSAAKEDGMSAATFKNLRQELCAAGSVTKIKDRYLRVEGEKGGGL